MSEVNKITFLKAGKLDQIEGNDLKNLIEFYNHDLKNTFSKKIDFLIMNEPDLSNKTYKQCLDAKIPTITEYDLIWMLSKEKDQNSAWSKKLNSFKSILDKKNAKTLWSDSQFVLANFKTESVWKNGKSDQVIPRYHYIDKKLIENKKFVKELLNKHPSMRLYETILSELLFTGEDELEIIQRILKKVKDKQFGFRDDLSLDNVFKVLRTNLKKSKELVRQFCTLDPNILKIVSKEFKEDEEIVFEAMKKDASVLKFASEKLKCDKAFILKVLAYYKKYEQSGWYADTYKRKNILNFVCEKLKNDREIVIKSLHIDGSSFEYLSPPFKDDDEIIKIALDNVLPKNSGIIQFASERLKNERSIAKLFIEKRGLNLKYLSPTLKDDKEMVRLAISEDFENIEYASENLINDLEFMIEIMNASEKNQPVLRYAGNDLINNIEFVKLAVELDESNIEYTNEDVLKDKSLALLRLSENPEDFDHLPQALKDDFEILSIAVKYDEKYIQHASDEIKNNKEVIKKLLNQNSEIFRYLSKDLRGDKEVINLALDLDEDNYCYIYLEDHELENLPDYLGEKRYKKYTAKLAGSTFSLSEEDETIKFKLFVLANTSEIIFEELENFAFEYDKNLKRIMSIKIVNEKAKEIFILLNHISKEELNNDKSAHELFKAFMLKEGQKEFDEKIVSLIFDNKLLPLNKARNWIEEYDKNPAKISRLMDYINSFDFETETSSERDDIIDHLDKLRLLPHQTSDRDYDFNKTIKKNYWSDQEIVFKASLVRPDIFKRAMDEDRFEINEVIQLLEDSKPKSFLLEPISEKYNSNKDVILRSVQKNGLVLSYASDELKDDIDVVIAAAYNDVNSLNYIGSRLKNDVELFKKIISIDDSVLMYAGNEIKDDLSKLIEITGKMNFNLDYVGNEVKNNPEVILEAAKNYKEKDEFDFKNNYIAKNLGKKLKNNKEFALELLEIYPFAYSGFSAGIKKDMTVIEKALKSDVRVFAQFSNELTGDSTVKKLAIQADKMQNHYGNFYDSTSNETNSYIISIAKRISQGNQNHNKLGKSAQIKPVIIRGVLSFNGLSLNKMPANYKSDKETVLIAVSNNGAALKYASDNLKSDRDVVLKAAINYGPSLLYANPKMLTDKELIKTALASNPVEVFPFLNEMLKDDRDVILSIFENQKLANSLHRLGIKVNKNASSGIELCREIAKKYIDHLQSKSKSNISPLEILIDQISDEYHLDAEVYFEDKKRSYNYEAKGILFLEDRVRCAGRVNSLGIVKSIYLAQDKHDSYKQRVSLVETSESGNELGNCEFTQQLKRNPNLIKQSIYGLSNHRDIYYYMEDTKAPDKFTHRFILQIAALYYTDRISGEMSKPPSEDKSNIISGIVKAPQKEDNPLHKSNLDNTDQKEKNQNLPKSEKKSKSSQSQLKQSPPKKHQENLTKVSKKGPQKAKEEPFNSSTANEDEIPKKSIKVIKKGTKHIEDNAFYNHFHVYNIKKLILPEGLKSIGDHAFEKNQISCVNIPEGLERIGKGAFRSNQLTSIVLPNSLTKIDFWAFAANELTHVVLPENLLQTSHSMFFGNKLTTINLPSKLNIIGVNSFRKNLLKTLIIPPKVESIYTQAFEDNQLESITIPASVNFISKDAFKNNPLKKIIIEGDQKRFNDMWEEIGFPRNLKPH